MRSVSRLPFGSNRQSSTFSAWAEKRAKLTPPPSQVAPRGWGRPGSRRTKAMDVEGLLPGMLENCRGERWQGQRDRCRTPLPRRGFRVDGAGIADIGAAVDAGVGIEPLFPPAGARQSDLVAVADHRREIRHDEDGL